MVKNGWDFLIQETLKSGLFPKWLDELSRLTEWYLDANSDGIIFVLIVNILGDFDI